MAFVHHTENPNGYTSAEVPAMLRAIYAFHRYANGWNDIGYNFVLDLFGRIWEARARAESLSPRGGAGRRLQPRLNRCRRAGNFSEVPISNAAKESLERLLAWKLSLHGVPTAGRVTVRVNPAGARYSRFPAGAHVSLPRIAGHRDGDCDRLPGDVLYGELPRIRRVVSQLAGRPARATLNVAAGASAEVACSAARSSSLTARRSPARPSKFSCGASPQGELVTEQTLAQAVTGSSRRILAARGIVPGAREGIWLRALSPGGPIAPAAVSVAPHAAVGGLRSCRRALPGPLLQQPRLPQREPVLGSVRTSRVAPGALRPTRGMPR